MPGLIRRSDIDEVRSRVNIADVIGEQVTLKSAGVGALKGLCPFHEERTPSFYVRAQVGRYHCFGCGEDGDVFSFLQKMEQVSFQEAVERLAARAGMKLHYEDGTAQKHDYGERTRLLAANAAAETFFRTQLAEESAQIARDFLGLRGFDQEAAQLFGIGYAPKTFDSLKTTLTAQGFTPEELQRSGLLVTGERGNSYDRFRGRVIWPIRDVTGQTLGFGARKLFDDDQGPKYLNTPETPVFHKSRVLYGLDLARRAIAKNKQVVIVEGYTDVMACHLAGVGTAVATCGTAFGGEHIRLVRRVLGDDAGENISRVGEVIFTFDPDEAGQKAASRAFAEEQRFAAQTFVAVPREGFDPCDLRLHRGDGALRELISSRKPMFEFMIKQLLAVHKLETVEGRVAALRVAAPVVAGIRDRALSDGYVRNLAGWLGIEPAEVSRAVRAAATIRRESPAGSSNTATRDEQQISPTQAHITELPTDPVTRGERDALMAILQYPRAVGQQLAVKALEAHFVNSTLAVIRDAVRTQVDHLESPDWLQRIIDQAPSGFRTLVSQLGVAPIPLRPQQISSYCVGVVTALVERDLLRRKAELVSALQRAGADNDRARQIELNRAAAGLEQERRELLGEA